MYYEQLDFQIWTNGKIETLDFLLLNSISDVICTSSVHTSAALSIRGACVMGRDGLKWFGVYLLSFDFLSLLLLVGLSGPLIFYFSHHQGGENTSTTKRDASVNRLKEVVLLCYKHSTSSLKDWSLKQHRKERPPANCCCGPWSHLIKNSSYWTRY